MSTFLTPTLLVGKFDMFHIQNATLAGGAAIGSRADLEAATHGGGLTTGMLAGVLSVVGFQNVFPSLEKALGLRDTCGVHNLHGMPAILGGVAAAVVLLADGESGATGHQFLALVVSLIIAVVDGAAYNVVASLVDWMDEKGTVGYTVDDAGALQVTD